MACEDERMKKNIITYSAEIVATERERIIVRDTKNTHW